MAAVTMAASSLVAFVAAPTAATTSSFSRFSSVRMAPVRATRRLAIVAMAQPEKTSSVEEAIAQANKACKDDPVSQPCAVAWDEVEEIAAEAAHQRDRKKNNSDPLEAYCADNPETDECRVYED